MILVLQVLAVIFELVAKGLSQADAVESAAQRFGLDPNEIKRWL